MTLRCHIYGNVIKKVKSNMYKKNNRVSQMQSVKNQMIAVDFYLRKINKCTKFGI